MGTGLDPARVEAIAWALGASVDLVLAVDRDGRIAFANDAARERWPAATVSADVLAAIPEEAQALFRATIEDRSPHGSPCTRFDWGEHGPDGSVRRWFSTTITRLPDAAGHLFVSADRSEQKRTELRLRRSEQLMVDTQGVAHLGTWEWDVSEPNATWSAELYRIYGLTPESYTPSYEAYLTKVHPDDRPRVIEATNRVFKEHVPYSHDERIFRPDGSMRYLHTWAHPVLDGAGKLTRLVGVCQDITHQKLAEEEVKQLNADLERRVAERTLIVESSKRDVEAFNATVSHDLRAPLSVVQLSCDMILAKNATSLPPGVEDHLARIQRSVVFMTALVNDLLTLSQVGHATLKRAEFDLSAASEEILADLRRSAPDRVVEVDVTPGLRFSADAPLLRAALENLLRNAWKYSSRVPVARIEVGATTEESGPRAFYVRDNGAGFDMSEAHRLFAPFERLHKSSEFEGTGVGLAAVHRIVERHGGRIWAESEPARGATFYVTLPG